MKFPFYEITVPLEADCTNGQVWLWWEWRRLVYNLICFSATIASFILYAFFIFRSGHLSGTGEDLIEPMAIPFYAVALPICWNIAYCLGPIVNIIAGSTAAAKRELGPKLLVIGIGFSLIALSLPATYWGWACLVEGKLFRFN